MDTQINRRAFLGSAALAAGTCLFPTTLNGLAARQSALPRIADLPPGLPEQVGMAPDLSARIGAFMQNQIALIG